MSAHKLEIHLALWRLDSRIAPFLTREEDRPYNHFSAVYAPSLALQRSGKSYASGSVLELSPLVGAELPDWVRSISRPTPRPAGTRRKCCRPLMNKRLAEARHEHQEQDPARARPLPATDRSVALKELAAHVRPDVLFTSLHDFDEPPRRENTALVLANPINPNQPQTQNQPQGPNQGPYQMAQQVDTQQQRIDPEFLNRAGQNSRFKQEINNNRDNNDFPDVAIANTWGNGERWFSFNPKRVPASEQVAVSVGTMVPVWLTGDDGIERLVIARLVRIGEKQVCQGLLLDWARLQEHLKREVADRFPEATFVPAREGLLPEKSDRAMSPAAR